MTSRNSISRRIRKLEAIANVLSTADKWALIDRRTRQLTADEGTIASRETAFWMAMSDAPVRFTIPEMDQLLAASDQ